MALEGAFPKTDGDIAYASEANRYATAGRFITAGSTAILASGTNTGSVIGSILINAGSLANYSAMYMPFITTLGSQNNFRIALSGTTQGENGGNYIEAGSNSRGQNNYNGFFTATLGSPGLGFIMIQTNPPTFNNNDSSIAANGIRTGQREIDQFYIGSPFVLFMMIDGNAFKNSQVFYALQGFGGY